jgi:hypothetical protein
MRKAIFTRKIVLDFLQFKLRSVHKHLEVVEILDPFPSLLCIFGLSEY